MNLTIEVKIVFLSVIPLFISSFLLYLRYRKHPDFTIGIMIMAWFSYGVFSFMSAISYLFLSKKIFLMKSLLLPVFLIFVEIMVSFISNNRLHPVRFPLVSVFAATVTYAVFLPNAVISDTFPNGDKTLIMSGVLRTITAFELVYVMIVYSFFTFKMYYFAIGDLKYWAKINLTGTIIFAPLAGITFLVKINRIIPGVTEFVFSFGIMISAIAFYKRPQLFYVLPYNASKLIVINGETGLPIYSYQWKGKMTSSKDQLFSNAINSFNSFASSAIQQGNITHVKLEEAILLIHIPSDHLLYYALLATKTSKTLRSGLEKFSSLFYLRYRDKELSRLLIEKSETEDADKLVDNCFPYIPTHNI